MDEFQYELVWELGDGRIPGEPYFDLAVGYYHFAEEGEVNLVHAGYVGYVDGRLAIIYGFRFVRRENTVGQRHSC